MDNTKAKINPRYLAVELRLPERGMEKGEGPKDSGRGHRCLGGGYGVLTPPERGDPIPPNQIQCKTKLPEFKNINKTVERKNKR